MATEVAGAMIAYGWRSCHLKRIIATIDPANVASANVVKKLRLRFVSSDVDEDGLPSDLYEIEPDDASMENAE